MAPRKDGSAHSKAALKGPLKEPFEGPFKGRNMMASADQLVVLGFSKTPLRGAVGGGGAESQFQRRRPPPSRRWLWLLPFDFSDVRHLDVWKSVCVDVLDFGLVIDWQYINMGSQHFSRDKVRTSNRV